ncbi:hypothetical protein Slin15195_G049750 [Septoria linicola]|uniref:Uncharacterized protein n=1 Tax=Septoria linicola TaxID=215465 RepID=A0A9Q9AVX6_9PEZI|nr:hypothetical protein Slin14017_G053280 [Septoria linicola]USW51656.1 hypothetical protein Slin15195_G049750 [Septoria linicola]
MFTQPVNCLFTRRQINREFKRVINISPELQRLMFLRQPRQSLGPWDYLLSPLCSFFDIPYSLARPPGAQFWMPPIRGYDEQLHRADHERLLKGHADAEEQDRTRALRKSPFLGPPGQRFFAHPNASWRKIKLARSSHNPAGRITLVQPIWTRPPRYSGDSPVGYFMYIQLDLDGTLGDLYRYYDEVFTRTHAQHHTLQNLANRHANFSPTGMEDRMGDEGPTQGSLALQHHSAQVMPTTLPTGFHSMWHGSQAGTLLPNHQFQNVVSTASWLDFPAAAGGYIHSGNMYTKGQESNHFGRHAPIPLSGPIRNSPFPAHSPGPHFANQQTHRFIEQASGHVGSCPDVAQYQVEGMFHKTSSDTFVHGSEGNVDVSLVDASNWDLSSFPSGDSSTGGSFSGSRTQDQGDEADGLDSNLGNDSSQDFNLEMFDTQTGFDAAVTGYVDTQPAPAMDPSQHSAQDYVQTGSDTLAQEFPSSCSDVSMFADADWTTFDNPLFDNMGFQFSDQQHESWA